MISHAKKHLVVTAVVGLVAASPAFGWWDTIVKNWTYPPLVESFKAETLPGVPKDAVQRDDLSFSKCSVQMIPGGATLAFSRELQPSTYVVYIVGRSPRQDDIGDPGALSPFFFKVTITDPAGKTQSYRLRACRVCAYTSIALHAARPHSTQALSRSEAGLPCFCESASRRR